MVGADDTGGPKRWSGRGQAGSKHELEIRRGRPREQTSGIRREPARSPEGEVVGADDTEGPKRWSGRGQAGSKRQSEIRRGRPREPRRQRARAGLGIQVGRGGRMLAEAARGRQFHTCDRLAHYEAQRK